MNNNWVYLYLDARNIRVLKDSYDRDYVYQGSECLLNKERGTNEINILVDKIDYNDLKAIMEVL